jgi:hypothetical protein
MAYTTTAQSFFAEVLPPTLQDAAAPLRQVGGLIEFDIQGPAGGTWFVDLEAGRVLRQGTAPDCIVRAADRDFAALVEGRMSVSDGLLTERLTVAGEAGRLVRLFEALSTLRAG